MKAILAEAEVMQAASRTQSTVATSVQRQRSGDRMRVSFSLSKTPDSPHLSLSVPHAARPRQYGESPRIRILESPRATLPSIPALPKPRRHPPDY
jgi:hypothetical protein